MTARGIVLVFVFASVLFYTPATSAQEILHTGDVYVDSDIPTQVPWKVVPISDKQTSFYCDKTEQSVFDMGKTIVRCIVSDAHGNDSRTSFVVTVGYTIVQIPGWFEHPTRFWLDGMISDKEYVASIKSLMMQGVIQIPTAEFEEDYMQNVPVWVKQNAQKWIDQKITDDEFSIGLQWMTKNF